MSSVPPDFPARESERRLRQRRVCGRQSGRYIVESDEQRKASAAYDQAAEKISSLLVASPLAAVKGPCKAKDAPPVISIA